MEFDFTHDSEKMVSEIFLRTMTEVGISFEIIETGTLKLPNDISDDKLQVITNKLSGFGVKLQTSENRDIVEDIKVFIIKMVRDWENRNMKMSELLSEKFGFSYPYLSNLFSSKTYTSIENFYILVRIEEVKELLIREKTTLSEIAFNLSFSSVPHLSSQFKKVTGLTITQYMKFRKIKKKFSSAN